MNDTMQNALTIRRYVVAALRAYAERPATWPLTDTQAYWDARRDLMKFVDPDLRFPGTRHRALALIDEYTEYGFALA